MSSTRYIIALALTSFVIISAPLNSSKQKRTLYTPIKPSDFDKKIRTLYQQSCNKKNIATTSCSIVQPSFQRTLSPIQETTESSRFLTHEAVRNPHPKTLELCNDCDPVSCCGSDYEHQNPTTACCLRFGCCACTIYMIIAAGTLG